LTGGEGATPPSRLERIVGGLALGAAGLAAVLVLAMLAITSYGVLMRYVLDAPVTWSDELAGHLVVAMVMLGTADALLRGEHISVDLLTDRLRGRARTAVAVWGMLCVLALAAALGHAAVLTIGFSYDFGMYSEGYLEAPLWIPQSFLLVGAVLLGLAALARIHGLLRR
jgi:TRAP-type C4-dicarboxylate transport system permease small subunit